MRVTGTFPLIFHMRKGNCSGIFSCRHISENCKGNCSKSFHFSLCHQCLCGLSRTLAESISSFRSHRIPYKSDSKKEEFFWTHTLTLLGYSPSWWQEAERSRGSQLASFPPPPFLFDLGPQPRWWSYHIKELLSLVKLLESCHTDGPRCVSPR